MNMKLKNWFAYQTDDNLINEREQVGNFVPDEDHANDLHAGAGHYSVPLILNKQILCCQFKPLF